MPGTHTYTSPVSTAGGSAIGAAGANDLPRAETSTPVDMDMVRSMADGPAAFRRRWRTATPRVSRRHRSEGQNRRAVRWQPTLGETRYLPRGPDQTRHHRPWMVVGADGSHEVLTSAEEATSLAGVPSRFFAFQSWESAAGCSGLQRSNPFGTGMRAAAPQSGRVRYFGILLGRRGDRKGQSLGAVGRRARPYGCDRRFIRVSAMPHRIRVFGCGTSILRAPS